MKEIKKGKIHLGCGGEVEKGICNKCGKKFEGPVRKWIREPFIIKGDYDEKEMWDKHRRRIREGWDLR